MKERLVNHPLHFLLAYFSIGYGLILIFNDNYYFWPPDQAPMYNSDFVGTWGLFTGIGLIYVAIQKNLPRKGNLAWLLSQCAFLGFETGLELAHGLVSHNAHMMSFSLCLSVLLLLTFYIIRVDGIPYRESKNVKDRIAKREKIMHERR